MRLELYSRTAAQTTARQLPLFCLLTAMKNHMVIPPEVGVKPMDVVGDTNHLFAQELMSPLLVYGRVQNDQPV
ncbi:hypothetical protein [Ferrimonas pelagia]|uniref:hypothetical protein n=1 Tax=Ferrimonas pelagia TaxID=1177826 RepID=UPI0031E75A1F